MNMKVKILACLLGVFSLTFLSVQTDAKGAIKEKQDIYGQGISGPLVSINGASLIRTKNGVTASMRLPTPVSGEYNYPPSAYPGTPEVFTGWFFFFNDPENCAVPNDCVPPPPMGATPNDFTTARGGVYNFSGHAISESGTLNMVGHISVGETQFGGPFALDNPFGAEIHLAVAPHGVLVPLLMPQQMRTPIGNPSFWWLAAFR